MNLLNLLLLSLLVIPIILSTEYWILLNLIENLTKSWGISIGKSISPKYHTQLSIQRQELKAFRAFDRVYQTISNVGSNGNYLLEDQHEVCENYINNFKRLYPNQESLAKKLELSLYYKSKSLVE